MVNGYPVTKYVPVNVVSDRLQQSNHVLVMTNLSVLISPNLNIRTLIYLIFHYDDC
jgi:hypothetical protein